MHLLNANNWCKFIVIAYVLGLHGGVYTSEAPAMCTLPHAHTADTCTITDLPPSVQSLNQHIEAPSSTILKNLQDHLSEQKETAEYQFKVRQHLLSHRPQPSSHPVTPVCGTLCAASPHFVAGNDTARKPT